jgi:membrane protease YdiL (CAAX protease family)
MKGIWSQSTPYSQLLITVGVILISATLFTILGSLAASFIYGLSMTELSAIVTNTSHPRAIPILKIMQTMSATGTFIVPPFVLAYLFSTNSRKYLSLDRKPGSISILVALVLMVVATPVINFLGEINSFLHLPEFLRGVEEWMKQAEAQAAELTTAFLRMDTINEFLINLFMIALIPAIGEELLFRGIIQNLFLRWSKNVHVSVWTAAVLFSALHMQFYGFLPRMILGGMLGYMLVWSGSLWLPIVAHFVNNAAAVIFYYLFQHNITTIDPDKIGTGSDFVSLAGSFLFTVVLLAVLRGRGKGNLAEAGQS